jgi:hypothetical protein
MQMLVSLQSLVANRNLLENPATHLNVIRAERQNTCNMNPQTCGVSLQKCTRLNEFNISHVYFIYF